MNIDCLLKNTEYANEVEKYMKYLATDMVANGKEASFREVYKKVKDSGLDLDVESAGYMYQNAKLAGREGYSSLEDVIHESSREWNETARNLLLDESPIKENGKEQQIGDLSPSKNISRRLIRALKGENISDTKTKSVLRQLQDMYAKTMDRMENKEAKPGKEDNRSWEQVLDQGFERMKVGETDLEGTVLNLKKVHEGVNKEMEILTKELRSQGKDLEADQLEHHVEGFKNALYEVALSSKEAKTVIDGALISEGYAKKTKAGEIVTDYEKLSGDTHNVPQLKEKVVAAMQKYGLDEFTANRVADSLGKELQDRVELNARIQDKKDERNRASHDKKLVKADAPKIDDVVADSVKNWENYTQYEGREGKPLIISKKTAGDALRHALQQMGFIRKLNKKEVLNVDALSRVIDNPPDIREHAKAYFESLKDASGKRKFTDEQIEPILNAMDSMYEDTFDKIREHVIGKQDAIEQTWNNPGTPKPKNIVETIKKTLADFQRYQAVTKDNVKKILFRKPDAKNIIAEALKTKYSKTTANGEMVDMKQVAKNKPTEADLKDMVREYLKKNTSNGLNEGMADSIWEGVKHLYPDLVADIDEFNSGLAKNNVDTLINREKKIDESWQPVTPNTAVPKTAKEIIDSRTLEMQEYAKATGDYVRKPIFRRSDAKRILSEVVKAVWGKDTADGREIYWKKLGIEKPTESDIKEAVRQHLETDFPAGSPIDADRVAESLKNLYPEFVNDISQHAEAILKAKEIAAQRDTPERKSLIRQMVELHGLGIFDTAHKELLERTVGVKDIDLQTKDEIEAIVRDAGDLFAKTGETIGHYQEDGIVRRMSDIVERNIASKSKMYGVARFIQNWFAIDNFTKISRPLNKLENFISGMRSKIGSDLDVRNQTGGLRKGRSTDERKLWRSSIADAAMGATTGGSGDKFGSPSQVLDKMNSLDPKKGLLKATGTAMFLLDRAASNGMDLGTKLANVNKRFFINMHEMFVRQGWSNDEATGHLHDMLYGQSLSDAITEAASIVDQHWETMGVQDNPRAKMRAAIRLANDKVKMNLVMAVDNPLNVGQMPVTKEMIEAAYKSAEHVASISMGHEANNIFSRKLQAGKTTENLRIKNYEANGEYRKASLAKINKTLLYDGVLRLAGGGANWAVLGIQEAGLRLPLDLLTYYGDKGTKNAAWDFSDSKELEKKMTERQANMARIRRAYTGLMYTAGLFASVAAYGALRKQDDEEDDGAIISGLKGINKSPFFSRAFKKLGGVIPLLTYMMVTEKGEGSSAAIASGLEVLEMLTNSSPFFSAGNRTDKAVKEFRKNEDEKATALIGQVVGSYLPGLPLIDPWRETVSEAKELATGKPREQMEHPRGGLQGYLNRSFIQQYMQSSLTEEEMKAIGLESLTDALGLESFSNWANEPDVKGSSHIRKAKPTHRQPAKHILRN